MESAAAGDILVVDNAGRIDESCVGDLIAREAQAAGLRGLVIWGLHRDTAELRTIGLPVFSLGAIPTGPQKANQRDTQALTSAVIGEWIVSQEDVVLGDDDGVLFLPAMQVDTLLTLAEFIRDTEFRQAERIRDGVSLRAQVRFSDYLAQRQQTPSLTFRQHLRTVGGAIEE
jgi:regulator of RNase E activity RraA